MSHELKYLVYSREHNAWWGPNRSGYLTCIENAGRYTLNEAAGCACSRDRQGDGSVSEFVMLAPESAIALLDELEAARKVVEVARGVQEFLTPRAGEVDLRRGGDAALWHGDLKKAIAAHAAAGKKEGERHD